jgi:hypothetical protein
MAMLCVADSTHGEPIRFRGITSTLSRYSIVMNFKPSWPISKMRITLRWVTEVHHIGPRCNEIFCKLFLGVPTGMYFCEGAQLGMRTAHTRASPP